MPQKLAGWRIEPPVSVPMAASVACAATAAAEPPPRVLDRAIPARRARRAHRELVEVRLTEHDRAGLPQLVGHRRFVGWMKAVEDVRSCSGQNVLGAEEVLDRDRDAVERQRLPARNAFVR